MKIKTGEYLEQLRLAELRGYEKGREAAWREAHESDREEELRRALAKMRNDIDILKKAFEPVDVENAWGNKKEKPMDVGEEIAQKFF